MVLARLLLSWRLSNSVEKKDLEAEVGGREGDALELQKKSRSSTETQSMLPDHGDRILEGIQNGQ